MAQYPDWKKQEQDIVAVHQLAIRGGFLPRF